MKKSIVKRLLTAVAAAVVVGGMALPAHAGSTGASDSAGDTIEPILVKSDAQVSNPLFRTTALGEANLQAFSLSAAGGTISASITTKDPLPTCSGGTCTSNITAPYGGVHVMVLFQTQQLDVESTVGCADVACAGDSKWQRRALADRFYWFLYYGATVNQVEPDFALGVYDPSGRLVGLPLEPGIGQVFGILGQHYTDCPGNLPNDGDLPAGTSNNASATVNGNNVVLSIPYNYQWRLPLSNSFPCGARSKQVVNANDAITNAVAFSWVDHSIEGPDPIGLILGWTWYTDSIPAVNGGGGYKVGTPSGDPNPSMLAGPTCPANTRGVANPLGGELVPAGNKNPLYSGAPCMFANPIGPGFTGSGLNLSAG